MQSALIGYTGFVGSNLLRSRSFDRQFNSTNITEIAGDKFDEVICAGVPSVMWAANADPQADTRNLGILVDALRKANIGRLILVSTIGVFDDVSAQYTESNAQYEQHNAYGRNRRQLEVELASSFSDTHIIRLPALFGPGLKKNFLFDILNPEPSFIKPDKFDVLLEAFPDTEAASLQQAYAYDGDLEMWAYKRADFANSDVSKALIGAFTRENFLSTQFTNSESRFQYYNLTKLSDDINTAVQKDVDILNICSAPVQASEIHKFLTGKEFTNTAPPCVREDVRSNHATAFGSDGNYLYEKGEILDDLKRFYSSSMGQL
ncbi:MAG: NAD(P)H-binding protein [Parasphingorhabdus sp.]|uniref:NAD-dependent epimerase/dehydratase family protein n=1 Tax=Parasphingorhabdus sp. TaxID=2709688 RepID=UPI003298AB21